MSAQAVQLFSFYYSFSYLSFAVLCHPIHRQKIIDLSQQLARRLLPPEENPLVFFLENLFSNLAQKFGSNRCSDTDEGYTDEAANNDDKLIAHFMEDAISTAISFT